jgi:hypothetical protein
MKIKWLVLLAVFLSLVAGACGSSPSTSAKRTGKVDELDTAIREASDYLNENIPKGSKIVILNIESVSPDLSNYVIDELIANAVNDKVFSVVDRRQLDTLRAEQRFQLSGEVNDKDALAIGKFFGAQTIISGAVSGLGTGYRIRIRALAVQTAQVQGQFNRNITSSMIISSLIANGAGNRLDQALSEPAKPAMTGTAAPGNNLNAKLSWLQRNVKSNTVYILEVRADESINPFDFEFNNTDNVTVIIRGDNVKRTISLRTNGTLKVRPGVTLVFDNNITLVGHNGNVAAMVDVYGGSFIMNAGSAIYGNGNGHCGVFIAYGGTFEMNGGEISGNADTTGGGVQIFNDGASFTMNGGIISGNIANKGGGVVVNYGCEFTMNGGTITGNTALEQGGGVYVFGTFTKNGGTITGYASDQSGGNVVRDNTGVLNRRGHAVFVSDNRRKETTAGQRVNLNSNANAGWDR